MTNVPIPFPAHYPKTSAFEELARSAGIDNANPYGREVAKTLADIGSRLVPLRNTHLSLALPDGLKGMDEVLIHPAHVRQLKAPVHLSEMPASVPHTARTGFTPDYKVLSISDGYLYTSAHFPVIIDSTGSSIITGYSSEFAPLVYYYEDDVSDALGKARYIDGTVFVMFDDIAPLNYCHWIVDGLPRLTALGFSARRSDCYVAAAAIETAWQIETLKLCGFDENRIIGLDNFSAVQARQLMVPSHLALSQIPHPAFKGAPWALAYLRSTLGYGSRSQATRAVRRQSARKLYISRRDAAGRRILNEDSFYAVLRNWGYQRICLGGLSVADQIALFASASHIIGIHGAGLTNIVFAETGCKILEIFPVTYGTPAYYILAAAQELPYYTYVTSDVRPGNHPTFDDIVVEIDHFMTRCADLMGADVPTASSRPTGTQRRGKKRHGKD